MPRISDLNPTVGATTNPGDLFVTVGFSGATAQTKKITRRELVRAIEQETFVNLQVLNGEFDDLQINVDQIKDTVGANDYFILMDETTGTAYRYTIADLNSLIVPPVSDYTELYVGKDLVGVPDGSRTNPFGTIEEAVAAIETNVPTTIWVGPGTYTVASTINIPDNCSIISLHGAPMTAIAGPATFVFELGSNSKVKGFTSTGQSHDNILTPTSGFFARFRPGAYLLAPPVLEDIVQMSNYNALPRATNVAALHPNIPAGGGIFSADASVLAEATPLLDVIVVDCRSISCNGVALTATKKAHIHARSIETSYNRSFATVSLGGRITSHNSTTNYGDMSFVGGGKEDIVFPLAAAGAMTASNKMNTFLNDKPAIMARLSSRINGLGYTSNHDVLIAELDDIFEAVMADFGMGTDHNTRAYGATCYSRWGNGNLLDSTTRNQLTTILTSWFIADLTPTVSLTSGEETQINLRTAILTQAWAGTRDIFYQKSTIVANNHTFNYVGTGVTKATVDISKGGAFFTEKPVEATIYRTDTYFKCIFSGQTQTGKQYLAGGLTASGRKLSGKAIMKQQARARRSAIARTNNWS